MDFSFFVEISVYKERSLQTVTNWFIVSLAFADLFVTIPMVFSLYVLVRTFVYCICDDILVILGQLENIAICYKYNLIFSLIKHQNQKETLT